MHLDFIESLRRRLRQPLPGQAAQYRMAHVGRQYAPPAPEGAKQAAVLALFYPKSDDWHLVLIERAGHQEDRHRGQIGFPGGRYEPQDADQAQTALREAEEEVAAPADRVELLGRLTQLYIPVSNFLVHPYVGFLEFSPAFQPQAEEVASIIEVPFEHLRRESTQGYTDLTVGKGLTLRGVPFFDVHGHVVWGATAMMLNELLEALRVETSQ